MNTATQSVSFAVVCHNRKKPRSNTNANTHTTLDEETVDAVAISLHRHREARRKGPWPNMWTKYADLDEKHRNEYRARAAEVVMAVQGTDTVDKAVDALAALWRNPGPAKARYTAYARERLTETLSDVPTLKETK